MKDIHFIDVISGREKKRFCFLMKDMFLLITPIGDNQFWIGTTTGVLKVDLTEKRIITTCFQEENITTQFLDSESRLWLSAKSGLAAVVSLNGESIVLNDSGGSSIPYIHCFTEDTRG